jgi:opacity protein-like surface antigen
MKKVLFAIILVSLVNFKSFTQNKQGSLAVSGTLNLDIENDKNENGNVTVDGPKTTYFRLVPSVEYFITDRFSAGLGIGYAVNRTKDISGTTTTIKTSGAPVIQPYVRMYFPMGEKVSIFGEASIYLEPGKTTTKTTVGNQTNSTSNNDFTINIGLTPGLSLSLSDKIAIDATYGFIGYKHYKEETGTNSSVTYNHAVFEIDPTSITLGIKFFIF